MKTPYCLTIALVICIQSIYCQTTTIHFNKASPQQVYAASILEKTFVKKEVNLVISEKLSPESFTITAAGKTITVRGGDERGLIYGCLSLREDIRNGVSWVNYQSKTEKPFL